MEMLNLNGAARTFHIPTFDPAGYRRIDIELLCAIYDKDVKLMDALVKKGANPNIQDRFPLLLAVDRGNYKVVKYLVDFWEESDQAAWIPQSANEKERQILCEWSQKLCTSIKNEYDACLSAGEHGSLDIVKILVDHFSKTSTDLIFRIAAQNGHLDIVKFLVSHGADVFGEDHYALQFAAADGHLDVVKYLVEECHEKYDKSTEWALIWARNHGHRDVVEYLVNHGFKIE